MSLSKMTRHGQITMPKSLRDELNLVEGDYVEVSRDQEGIHLRPKKVMNIDPDQAYFWNDKWQERDRQADEDIRSGRIHRLESVDDLDR